MNEYIKLDMLTSLYYLPLQSVYLDSILYFFYFFALSFPFFSYVLILWSLGFFQCSPKWAHEISRNNILQRLPRACAVWHCEECPNRRINKGKKSRREKLNPLLATFALLWKSGAYSELLMNCLQKATALRKVFKLLDITSVSRFNNG